MHAIVSVLPEPYRIRVIEYWRQLRSHFGVRKIMEDPYPHFSWHLAGEYSIGQVYEALKELTNSQECLKVQTSGIGIFTGANPVLFIPVVKTERMLDLHTAIWQKMVYIARNENMQIDISNYNPDNWIPHITLAFRDTDTIHIGDMVEMLVLENFRWHFDVDNLAIVDKPPGENGRIVKVFNFKKS